MNRFFGSLLLLLGLLAALVLAGKMQSCWNSSMGPHDPNPAHEIVFPSVPPQPPGNFHR